MDTGQVYMMNPSVIFEFGKEDYILFEDIGYGVFVTDEEDIFIYKVESDGYSERLGKLYSLYTKSVIEEVHYIKNEKDSMNYPVFSKKCLDLETESGSFISIQDRRLFNLMLNLVKNFEQDDLDDIVMQINHDCLLSCL